MLGSVIGGAATPNVVLSSYESLFMARYTIETVEWLYTTYLAL